MKKRKKHYINIKDNLGCPCYKNKIIFFYLKLSITLRNEPLLQSILFINQICMAAHFTKVILQAPLPAIYILTKLSQVEMPINIQCYF